MMNDSKMARSEGTAVERAVARDEVWRGPAEYAGTPEQIAELAREFPPGASELEVPADGVSRRHFMSVMGASAAFAGAALTGCIRKPKERIVPMAERPEDLIPGRPRYFRTAFHVGNRVLGLHVESQDGRPTKVEGNPDHPMSLGRTDHWAQASVLDLYDPQRTKTPRRNGNPSSWQAFAQFLSTRERAGSMAFVLPVIPSPSLADVARRLKARLPDARFYVHDPIEPGSAEAARRLIGAEGFTPTLELDRAAVVLSIDADIFGAEGDSVRNQNLFMRGRTVVDPSAPMNRLYVVEPGLTVTGMTADNRLPLAASECGPFLALVAAELGMSLPTGMREALTAAVSAPKWVTAVTTDLRRAGAAAVVVAGARQPAWVHALAHQVNQMLGSGAVRWAGGAVQLPEAGDLGQFIADATAGEIGTAFFLDTNPFYTAGFDQIARLEAAIRSVDAAVHVGQHQDETAIRLKDLAKLSWHLPLTHYLEQWGDLRSSDGTVSLQQPLIAPLWGAISLYELLDALATGGAALAALGDPANHDAGHAVVKRYYTQGRAALSEDGWRIALNKGVVAQSAPPASPGSFDWSRVGAAVGAGIASNTQRSAGQLELVFALDYSVADGRFATNAWLQELPDPATKLTWDNALLMSPRTAAEFGVGSGNRAGRDYTGDLVELRVGEQTLRTAVMVLPGLPDRVMVLALGYGRAQGLGAVAGQRGFDAYRLRSASAPWWTNSVSVRAVGDFYPLATTQEHWSLSPREGYEERRLVEYFTREQFAAKSDVLLKEWNHHMHEIETKRLYAPPEVMNQGQQWAMVIDLTKCTGCSACVVACQAENNIPVVGKERVLNGREMHWIRVDRYFTGTYEQPGRPVTMPVPCMQCETAPCETVCPVAATQHSPDGLNDMAYNRCIGTRYCLNNCPYKVRRFNFFNYQKERQEENPLLQLVRNPDVTVRFRGVMEKCTYCTQRITEARIQAKVNGDGFIPDLGVLTACQQACPADAIVFGDFKNPESAVSRAKENLRNYMLLAYLNTLPRTTYLAQIRNPHEDLV